MKAGFRIFISILMVLICGANLFAQITITEQSLAGVGSFVEFRFSFDELAVNEGSSGANQSWDVTGYDFTDVGFKRMIDPSVAEHNSLFPSATHCRRDSSTIGSFTDTYAALSDGQYIYLGSVTISVNHPDPGIVVLDPPALSMPIPLTFGTPSWTSVSGYSEELFPGDFFGWRDSTIYSVDGWGTIETDNETYQALRVFSQSWTISWTTGFPNDTNIYSGYRWVDVHGNTICSMSTYGLNPDFDTAYVDVAHSISFVDAQDELPIVVDFSLSQNYPNPFNSSTQIQYSLPITSAVQMRVFDVLGREVVTLLNGDLQTAGSHLVNWNGRNAAGMGVATGMYVVRMEAGGFRDEVKMMLVK